MIRKTKCSKKLWTMTKFSNPSQNIWKEHTKINENKNKILRYWDKSCKYCISQWKVVITDLQDFKTHKATFQIFADPFSFDVQDTPLVLQMELIDLQCNSELKLKFWTQSQVKNSKPREVSGKADKLGQFLRELPPTFPELSRMFERTMCFFESTYLCEKFFSTMNFYKSKYRSKLTDEHLQAILRVSIASSLKPNVPQLCERKCWQLSGS